MLKNNNFNPIQNNVSPQAAVQLSHLKKWALLTAFAADNTFEQ